MAARHILPKAIAERAVTLADEKCSAIGDLAHGFPKRELKDREQEIGKEIAKRIFVRTEDIRDFIYSDMVKRYGLKEG